MAHGQWTEVEARAVIAAWKKSGLSVEQHFARARGLVPQRLSWWRKKLETKDASSTSPMALLPVKVVEPRGDEPVTVLLRSGHMLKLGRDFDEVAFARVVALLEGG
jgi:hypothetical protein